MISVWLVLFLVMLGFALQVAVTYLGLHLARRVFSRKVYLAISLSLIVMSFAFNLVWLLGVFKIAMEQR